MTIFKNFIASIITNVQGNSDFKNLVTQLNNLGGFRQAVFAGFTGVQYTNFRHALENKGVEIELHLFDQEVISGVTLEVGHHTLRQNGNILGFMAYVRDFKMMFTMMLRNPIPDTLCFLTSFYEPMSSSQNSPKFPLWLAQQAQFVRGSASSMELLAQQGKESFAALVKKLEVMGSMEVPITNVTAIHQEVAKLFDFPVCFFHIEEVSENNLVVDDHGYINSKLVLQHLFALVLYENTMELAGVVSWHNVSGSNGFMVVSAARTRKKETVVDDASQQNPKIGGDSDSPEGILTLATEVVRKS